MPNGDVIVQINLVGAQMVDVNATVNVTVDPSSDFVESNASRPAVAPPTSGPHRYTIVAPNNDAAVLSVGQACSTRINDTGITGRTKSHIHWHTTETSKTMMCLGGVTTEGFAAHDGNNLGANAGFMMVTEGDSWIEANNHQYLISRTKDATLRAVGGGRRVRIQADDGEIDLVAKKNVYVSSPGVTISAPGEVSPNAGVNYQADWTGGVPKTDAGKFAKGAMSVVGALASAHDLGTKAAKTFKTIKDGEWKHTVNSYVDVAKWAGDAAKFGFYQAPSVIGLFSKSEPDPGTVKIGAESQVGILAGNKASIFGAIAFSAGSAIWTSVAGGVSASLKGRLFAGVGGMYTSLKGYRKVEMASDYGDAVLKAKKDVIVAATQAAKLSGVEYAQLSSEKNVYINAAEHVNIGCGSGDGLAVTIEPKKMHIGSHSSVDAIKNAPGLVEHLMTMDVGGDKFRIKWNNCSLNFDKSDASLRGNTIEINAFNGDTKIDGKSVHIC